MRVNQFLAQATGISRRRADELINAGKVTVNNLPVQLGYQVKSSDVVRLNKQIVANAKLQTIMLHKPAGYVTSRKKQGVTPTIYRLLPDHLHRLKPIGRLDKDSTGLLLLSNDGDLAQRLTHPSQHKRKHYLVTTDQPLTKAQLAQLNRGVSLDDGMSIIPITVGHKGYYQVRLEEGRNRQIRRSIQVVGRKVTSLHRDRFGGLQLGNLAVGEWRSLSPQEAADV